MMNNRIEESRITKTENVCRKRIFRNIQRFKICAIKGLQRIFESHSYDCDSPCESACEHLTVHMTRVGY